MRILKFRAWDRINKKMVFVSSISFKKSGEMWFATPDYSPNGHNEIVVDGNLMQLTGLLDKNGREIYDGDIIKARNIYGIKKIGRYGKPTEICWNDEWGSWDARGILCEDKIVIGNIYENPELLK